MKQSRSTHEDGRRARRHAGRSSLGLVPLGALALLAAGCHGAIFLGTPSAIYEQEPNDSLYQPQHLGLIGLGELIRIKGSITDSGFDPYDGFAVYVDAPCSIDFTLIADNPGADLDLCVFDGAGFEIGCFQSPGSSELGRVDVYGPVVGFVELHFVVNSFFGTSSYTLELRAHSLFSAASADEEGASVRIESSAPGDGERAGSFDSYVAEPLAKAEESAELDELATFEGLLIQHDVAGRIVDVQPIRVREDGVVALE